MPESEFIHHARILMRQPRDDSHLGAEARGSMGGIIDRTAIHITGAEGIDNGVLGVIADTDDIINSLFGHGYKNLSK